MSRVGPRTRDSGNPSGPALLRCTPSHQPYMYIPYLFGNAANVENFSQNPSQTPARCWNEVWNLGISLGCPLVDSHRAGNVSNVAKVQPLNQHVDLIVRIGTYDSEGVARLATNVRPLEVHRHLICSLNFGRIRGKATDGGYPHLEDVGGRQRIFWRRKGSGFTVVLNINTKFECNNTRTNTGWLNRITNTSVAN